MAPSTRSSNSNVNQNSNVQGLDKDPDKQQQRATAKMQGYKITDNERTRKYGIGANSLEMLLQKAQLKFPVSLFKI